MLSGWAGAAFLMAVLFALTGGDGPNDKAWFWTWLALATPTLVAMRSAHRLMMSRLTRGGAFARHIAVYGIGPTGQQLLGNYFGESNPDVRIVGLFDDRTGRSPDFCCGYPVRGDLDELIAYAREHRVDEVIVALPFSAEERIEAVLARLREIAADVKLAAPMLDVRGQTSLLERRGRFPVVPVMRVPLSDWALILKEIEDRVLGALILVLISPLLAVIAIAIKLDSPGPVLFRQMRWGYNNRMIEVLKFRTMRNDLTDANAEKLTTKDDPRVTRLGAFLRKTSLDELPQFINVVRGEMSIVGPRPHARAAKAGGLLYPDAVPDYPIRHKVKPGITGWAQINGWRGETQTVEQIQKRVEHDIEYVNKWSLLHDLKIIILTIFTGFTGKNAY
jgi:Undecaprenyl-phosphate glucose phosphotransferase